MHAKILTPVTLTLISKSAFGFQNLCLGFENCILLIYQLSYTFYVWQTHVLGQYLSIHLSIHAKTFTPMTLTSESAFQFQNLR